jgi:hypothetical protein
MNEPDVYFKGTDGMRRLKDYSTCLGWLDGAIDRLEEFADKRSKYLSEADRVKLAEYTVNLNEMYWRQFHNFIDKVHGYKKYLA